jgi:hypothetical protein
VITYYLATFFVVVFGIWLALFIQSHRLFYSFRAKYPEIAKHDIPYACEFSPSPEKFVYFFRHKSLDMLQNDTELWSLRRQVKILTFLSIVVPPLGFGILVTVAVFISGRF